MALQDRSQDHWRDHSCAWGAYGPAVEAWQAFVLNSMMEFGRASMMWMMMPFTIGQTLQAQSGPNDGARRLQSLLRHTADARKQAEDFTNRAYASSLDAGYRSFREFEAAALDRGTFDARLPTNPSGRRAA